MNTGTPLDLTPFGSVLQGIGLLYWFIVLAAMALVLWKVKGWLAKLLLTTTVLAIMVGPVAVHLLQRNDEKQQAKARLDAAMARFEVRCRSAGETITRTVDNVESVLLTNVRPKAKSSDRGDANWSDAALPNEAQGDWYIRNFLFWEHHEDKRSPRGYLNNHPSGLPGYQFVDVTDADGAIYRYRLIKSELTELSRELITGPPARYAISFVNMVDPADREKWIAGTKVLITDTATNEVIAEHTWFSIEPGQGSTAGFRSPWGFARTCPELKGWVGGPTRFFVDRVLKPKQEK